MTVGPGSRLNFQWGQGVGLISIAANNADTVGTIQILWAWKISSENLLWKSYSPENTQKSVTTFAAWTFL
jgi:hypothetical protein